MVRALHEHATWRGRRCIRLGVWNAALNGVGGSRGKKITSRRTAGASISRRRAELSAPPESVPGVSAGTRLLFPQHSHGQPLRTGLFAEFPVCGSEYPTVEVFLEVALFSANMGFSGCLAVPVRRFLVIGLRLLLLVPAGVPVRSGDSVLKDDITVRQGDSAVLKCSVDSKVSRVAWLNRTTILFAGKEKWSLDPRVILLENTAVTEYSIKIQNVNIHDEGPYVCSILTNKKPKSTKVHLTVQVPARITNITRDVIVNEGSSISLMCLAVGRPEASVVWRHNSPRGIYKFVAEGQHLELAEITKEQSGSYECITSNDISEPDIRTVQVTVNYPPFISKARSTGTSVGQKGVLQCEASAVPRADFEWYKEDRRLFNGLNGVKIENQGKQSLLIFFNVSEEDYGNYTCVAMNIMGISNASIILYGPGAMHDVNGSAMFPCVSLGLLLATTIFHLLKF